MKGKDGTEKALNGRTLGSLLQRPYGYIQRHAYGRLAQLGHAGVRPAHSAVFRNLQAEGSRISELAASAGMTKQSMGYLVDTLQGHGYLRQEADAEDGRAKVVRLTRKGEAVVAALQRFSGDLESDLAESFGRAWVDDLRAKLMQLQTFLDGSQARAGD